LDQQEDLLDELRAAAEPLTSSCDPEVSQKIEAAVAEAVTAWNDTCQSLLELCSRYQDAVRLWKQYREASEAVKAWADQQLDSVAQFKPEEALRQVKVWPSFPNYWFSATPPPPFFGGDAYPSNCWDWKFFLVVNAWDSYVGYFHRPELLIFEMRRKFKRCSEFPLVHIMGR
jgi:hypothetical protein